MRSTLLIRALASTFVVLAGCSSGSLSVGSDHGPLGTGGDGGTQEASVNEAGVPCCGDGQGWGGLPTTTPPVCEGCCTGLTEQQSVVGPGDLAYTCHAGDGGGGTTTPEAGLPCCANGQGWGGLPTTTPPVCEGCCAGLATESSLVGPGDLAYECVTPDGSNGDGGDASAFPCCGSGQGWGGLPTTTPPTCEGCCSGLSQDSYLVGPGDIGYTCKPPQDEPEGGACLVETAGYDTACVTDADCAAVPFGGDTCDPCHAGSGNFWCDQAAINVRGAAAYNAALQGALQQWVGTATYQQCVVAACPTQQAAVCKSGFCAIGQ